MNGRINESSRKRVVDHPALRRLQRKHFIVFDVLPFFGVFIAIGTMRRLDVGSVEFGVLFIMWLLTGIGISVGFQRLLTHKSFKAHKTVVAALAISGSMCGQGSVISWVAMHRRHHELSDREGDLHSPNLYGTSMRGRVRGFVHAHYTWMIGHPYPNVVQYAPDLLRDKTMVWIGRRYYTWVCLGLIFPAVLCSVLRGEWIGLLTGALWGGVVRIFILEHFIWALNSVCHMVGTRRFHTRDRSRNVGLLAPFIFGEAWHHNHHAFPASAWFGMAWYRIDPGYWFICVLTWVGLAREVNVPSEEQLRDLGVNAGERG